MRKSHHSRACARPHQQSCGVTCSLLSLIRFAFRRRSAKPLLLGFPSLSAGFPPCGRPLVGHPDDERFGNGETESDKSTISFVSYSSSISKGLESQGSR